MATKFRQHLLLRPIPAAMRSSLLKINLAALNRAVTSQTRAPASPAIRKAARAKAEAVIGAARAKVLATLSPTAAARIAALDVLAAAAKARLDRRWRSGAMRSPAQVLKSVVDRIDPDAGPIAQAEQTALLVRSDEPDPARFASALATAIGLRNATAMARRGILVRQVSAADLHATAVYSVRFPIKRGGMEAEVHNLAWALRKSGLFSSVRPDGGRRLIFAAKPGHAKGAERVFAWSHVLTRTDLAHALPPSATGAALGEGIIIAHPDTGWTVHPNLNEDRIDKANSFNASTGIKGGRASRTSAAFEVAGAPQLNHGTATASVMIGAKSPRDGLSTIDEDDLLFGTTPMGGRDYLFGRKVRDRNGTLTGVAPQATVRPIKFIEEVPDDNDGYGVVRFFDADLATAINYARTSDAHVISLSVGGVMDESVFDAIEKATHANLIIVAAAGQTYTAELTGPGVDLILGAVAGAGGGESDTVVLPAAYQNVLAVAGCTQDGRPWDESLRGPNVDITAPADAMWAADFLIDQDNKTRTPVIEAAGGTSFAAAFMAGVAALWLGHWGRPHLLGKYCGVPLAWVFRHQLQKTARAVRRGGWDTGLYGPGIVDVLALLKEPLPDPADVEAPPATVENALTVLSGLPDSPAGQAARAGLAAAYDAALAVAGLGEAFVEASWAAVRGTAETMLATGSGVLADLHAYAETQGPVIAAGMQDAITGLEALANEAAAAGTEAAEGASKEAEKKLEAVVDFVGRSADWLGEAGEDVGELFLGWAK